METCVRGFSYMPENKIDVNLQYIENGELERVWKVSRRQRLKEQEQRIWEEFVKEQDIVQKAYKDDPYQFLHELPENCLKELMEAELNKMKNEDNVEDVKGDVTKEQPNQGEGDHSMEKQVVQTVTFAEDDENSDLIIFNIFDDENEVNPSGGEDDQLESPSTVRERCSDDAAQLPPGPAQSTDTYEKADGAASENSTENVSHVIESSIYCARVRDLRNKLGEEMVAIMASLEIQDVMSVERAEVSRRCKRAAEFCARFNRIYMYQLQRQAHNIKRHVSQCLPLAQHTQFQSQMLRVVSLHQNTLQAFQVFHKSFPATSCLRECGRALGGMCAFVRDASSLCRAVPQPKHFQAARDLYDDEVLQTCDRLDAAVGEYALRVADFLSSTDVTTPKAPPPSSTRSKKTKKASTHSKTGTNTWSSKDTEARLSMYSLDTNLHSKPASSRDHHSSGTSKGHASPGAAASNKQQPNKGHEKPTKRVIRRPLMRAPVSSAPRPRPPRRDGDVPTMVEAVDTCESSHVMTRTTSPASRVTTPRHNTPRRNTPRHNTPRRNTPRPRTPQQRLSRSPEQHSPRSEKRSPRARPRNASPKVKSRTSPRNPPCTIPPTIRSDTPTTITTQSPIAPVTKIQCSKKQPLDDDTSRETPAGNPDRNNRSGKSTERSRDKTTDLSAKSTDRRNFDRGIERAGKNTDRSRNFDRINDKSGLTGGNEKISRRSKDNERLYVYTKSSAKNGSRKGEKNVEVDKNVENEVDSGDNVDIGSNNGNNHDKIDRPGHIGNPGKEDNTGREFCGVKELTDNDDDYSRSYLKEVDEERNERERNMASCHVPPARCDVTRLLRQLCSRDPAGLNSERVTGAKNAQLVCMRGASPPRQPSTPQLLRILEQTIQKQSPRPAPVKARNPERYRLAFNIPESTAGRAFHYRTSFVRHMLASPLYANSAVGKPWEMIASVSDKIIDELLTNIAKEMEISHVLRELYKCETN